TPIITALIIDPLTISLSGFLKLLAKLQIASQPKNAQNITVTVLPMENHPFGISGVKFPHCMLGNDTNTADSKSTSSIALKINAAIVVVIKADNSNASPT